MSEQRPNFLVLFCDQLRADAIGAYGHPFVRTPAMDSLAESGVLFERAYTPSPVCVAARFAMITGREPQRTGVCDNGNPGPDLPTFMSSLTDAGYRTHGIGKMHFEPDLYAGRGFETREVGEEFGDPERDDYMRMLQANGWGEVTRPHGQRDTLYYLPQLSPVPASVHPTQWVGDRSLAFLEEQTGDRPFLLWSSFVHPHPPFTPPEPWHLLYPTSLMPDPYRPPGSDSLMTRHQQQQNRYKCGDGGSDRRLEQAIRSYYLACVSFIDFNLRRILRCLDERGLRDNTLILFASDHGELLGDYGCYGKRSFLSASARIPLIVSGPGYPAGRSAQPATLCDLLPTLLSAAGLDWRALDPDGLPLNQLGDRDTVYGQFSSGDLGMYHLYHEGWRYIYSSADRKEYLLRPDWDPLESRNLAYNHYARDRVRHLRSLAVEHFGDLRGRDLEDEANNGPIRLGGTDPDPRRFEQVSRDPDAGLLVSGDAVPHDPDHAPYFDGLPIDLEGPGLW